MEFVGIEYYLHFRKTGNNRVLDRSNVIAAGDFFLPLKATSNDTKLHPENSGLG